jgi:sulfur carrier protein
LLASDVVRNLIQAPTQYNNPQVSVADEFPVTINGERQFLSGSPTLRQVVLGLNLEPERVAIELNREIVKRPLWDSTRVEAGAELEIVMFVGGG